MRPNERARGATLLDGGAPLGTALGALLIGPDRRGLILTRIIDYGARVA